MTRKDLKRQWVLSRNLHKTYNNQALKSVKTTNENQDIEQDLNWIQRKLPPKYRYLYDLIAGISIGLAFSSWFL